jgi:hypothetical protein
MTTPVISAGNLVVGEKDGFATFRVTLSAPSASAVTVRFSNSNGTAVNTSDYNAVAEPAATAGCTAARQALLLCQRTAAATTRSARQVDGRYMTTI